jgi:hypothetical protein
LNHTLEQLELKALFFESIIPFDAQTLLDSTYELQTFEAKEYMAQNVTVCRVPLRWLSLSTATHTDMKSWEPRRRCQDNCNRDEGHQNDDISWAHTLSMLDVFFF